MTRPDRYPKPVGYPVGTGTGTKSYSLGFEDMGKTWEFRVFLRVGIYSTHTLSKPLPSLTGYEST